MCDTKEIIRPKDKIEKYLTTLIKQHNGNMLETKYSRYFSFHGRVIRVSDHIGKNSSGVMSIIITEDNDYLLHVHSTNKIRNISYSDLKPLCKSMLFISNMWCDLATDSFKFATDEVTGRQKQDYIKKIQNLDAQLKGMGKVVSARDLKINELRKENNCLRNKLAKIQG